MHLHKGCKVTAFEALETQETEICLPHYLVFASVSSVRLLEFVC